MTPLEALAPCGISRVCKHAIAVSTSLLRLLAYAECWFISQREAWVDREVVVSNGFGQVIHGFRKVITFLGSIKSESITINRLRIDTVGSMHCFSISGSTRRQEGAPGCGGTTLAYDNRQDLGCDHRGE